MACYIRIPRGLVNRLSAWHGGQSSAVYSVMSRAHAGAAVDRKTVKRAVAELMRDGKQAFVRHDRRGADHAHETARQLRTRADVCTTSARRIGRKGRARKGLGGRRRAGRR